MADLKEWREQATGDDKIKMNAYIPMITIKDNKKTTEDVAHGVKKLKIVEGNIQSINNVRPGGKYEVEAAKKEASSNNHNQEVESDRG